jgi:hypothetical protein
MTQDKAATPTPGPLRHETWSEYKTRSIGELESLCRTLAEALPPLVEFIKLRNQCEPADNCSECELIQPAIAKAEAALAAAKKAGVSK